jgi:hypothetical protein
METTVIPGLKRFERDARMRLAALGERRIARASAFWQQVFSTRSVLSTVFDGPRVEVPQPAIDADLNDLAAVLPQDTVSRDPELRDQWADEPRAIAFIRQVEGHAPQPLACLAPPEDDLAVDAVSEARAMGFSIGQGERAVALKPAGPVRIHDRAGGGVTINTAHTYEELAAAADTAELGMVAPLADVYETPFEAAMAGIYGDAVLDRRFRRPWQLGITLPPAGFETVERVWAFADSAVAEAIFARVVRAYRPLFAETIPALDAALWAATGLWRGANRYRGLSGAALRVVFAGPRITRQVALMEASWGIERAGGVVRWRRPPPARADLDILCAAAGCARLSRPMTSGGAVPEGAIVAPKLVAVRGQARREQIVWYVRDLSRSIAQAQEVLDLPRDRAPPDLGSHNGGLIGVSQEAHLA